MIELRLESSESPESRFDFLLVARHGFFDAFEVLRDGVGVALGIGEESAARSRARLGVDWC